MAARRPFWKWHRWKSIGFCLWPPSTCIWNLKLKFQSKLDLCSGNHAVYRQTDGQTDKVNPVYPPSNFVGRGYKYNKANLRDLIAATGLVILLKLDLNRRFFSPCDLDIWWMTQKNTRAPLLCYFKLFASFRSHWWIQTGVTVRKRLIWVKIDAFF